MKFLLFSALLLIINSVKASDRRCLNLVASSCERNEQKLVSTYQVGRSGGFYFVKITQNLDTSEEDVKIIKTTIKQNCCLPDLAAEEIAHIRSMFSQRCGQKI